VDVNASIRKKLQEKMTFHLEEARRYGALMNEFGGAPAKVTRHRRTKEEIAAGVPKGTKKPRTPAQKAAIAKALATRKANLEAQKSKGAPLAVAAGE
jgi:hypothetical protein